MDRGALQAPVHGGHKELDMTERLNNNKNGKLSVLMLSNDPKHFSYTSVNHCPPKPKGLTC